MPACLRCVTQDAQSATAPDQPAPGQDLQPQKKRRSVFVVLKSWVKVSQLLLPPS
jgi:hypothetical protein